jgi:nucleoside-diphosphate-sugar epimerase
MKKVLVVGGAGYIGGLTVDFLAEDGYDVTVFDRLLYESRYLKPCNFVFGDIRNTSHLLDVAKDFQIIVYLAALVGDAACQVDLEHTENINHLAVKNFVNGLEPGKRLIFISFCVNYIYIRRFVVKKKNHCSQQTQTQIFWVLGVCVFWGVCHLMYTDRIIVAVVLPGG